MTLVQKIAFAAIIAHVVSRHEGMTLEAVNLSASPNFVTFTVNGETYLADFDPQRANRFRVASGTPANPDLSDSGALAFDGLIEANAGAVIQALRELLR